MRYIFLTIFLFSVIKVFSQVYIEEDTLYLCDGSHISIRAHIPATFDSVQWWFHKVGEYQWRYLHTNPYDTVLNVSLPGVYMIKMFPSQSIDSVFVKYIKCVDYELMLNLEGKIYSDNDTIDLQTNNDGIYVSFHTTAIEPPACYDFNDIRFFVVNYGDISLTDSIYIDLPVSGVYPIYVYAYDTHSCIQEALYYIRVWKDPDIKSIKDTIRVNEKSELRLNVAFQGEANRNTVIELAPYLFMNSYIFRVEPNLVFNDYGRFTISVNNAIAKHINSNADFAVLLNHSYDTLGYYTVRLISPDKQSYPIFNPELALYASFGEPTYRPEDAEKSITYPYVFTYDHTLPIFGSNISHITPYIDPTGYFELITKDIVPASSFYWNPSGTFYNSPINGNWDIEYEKNIDMSISLPVKLRALALMFNPDFFITKMKPKIIWYYNDNDSVIGDKFVINVNNLYSQKIKVVIRFGKAFYEKELFIEKTPRNETMKFVITPNGDGINDRWTYITRLPRGTFVRIYNSDGIIVDKFPVDIMPEGWDTDGVPSGNYWFIAQLPNGNVKSGLLVIIK